MKAYIITGTSRGLGEAIVKELLDEEVMIFCLSRSVNDELIDLALKKDRDLDYITYDLNDLLGIEDIMKEIMKELEEEDLEGIYLINNAGMLAPVMPIEKCEAQALSVNINVNLVAPMALTSVFIDHIKGWKIQKRVLNISSGAGKHGIFGWSAYCAAKAGVDRFTEAVGLEQAQREFPVEVVSMAPGIIDTAMQAEIRDSKEEDFIDLERFVGFKNNGNLSSPEEVASGTIKLLHSDSFVQGGILDIRNL